MLHVAFGARHAAVALTSKLESRCDNGPCSPVDGGTPHFGVTNHPLPTSYLFATRLELGLHEGHKYTRGLEDLGYSPRKLLDTDEGRVDYHPIDRFVEIRRDQVSGVDTLPTNDTWITPELLRELALADIDGINSSRAALQQAIGEATRGCANVDTNGALRANH
jgi:hypothetical protein